MIYSEPLLPDKVQIHDIISTLPEPLLLKIFSELDISTLLKCSQVGPKFLSLLAVKICTLLMITLA